MKIDGRPTLHLEIVISLTETEARALDAIAGYDTEAFLKVFYSEMGAAYLQPHEEGLRSLFSAIRNSSGISSILSRMRKTRDTWEGRG